MGKKNKKKSSTSQEPAQQQQQQQQQHQQQQQQQQQQPPPPLPQPTPPLAAKPEEHPPSGDTQPKTSGGKKQKKNVKQLSELQQPAVVQYKSQPTTAGQPERFQQQQLHTPVEGQLHQEPPGLHPPSQQQRGPPGFQLQQQVPPGLQLPDVQQTLLSSHSQAQPPQTAWGQKRQVPPGIQEQQQQGPPGGRGWGQQRQGAPGIQGQQQQGPPGGRGRGQQRQGPPGIQGQQQQGPPGIRGQQQQQQQQQQQGPADGLGQQHGPQRQQKQPSQPAVPAVRQPQPKVDATIVTKGVRALSLKVPPRTNIRGGGTKGRKTIIETNHLSLDISKARNNRIIHYDVAIDPDKPKRLIRFVMEQFRVDNYPDRYPAFDGKKNLYSSGYLPFQTHTSGNVVIQDEESRNPKEFKVTINFANMVNLDQLKTYMQQGNSQDTPMEVIQAVDIVLREASASSRSFVQVGRSFFTPPSDQLIDLGEGLELWYGFYQSAILGWRPFVNIDVAHKGFPKHQNVVQLICDLFRCDPRSLQALNTYQIDDLNKYLRTLKVDYELPNQPNTKRCYRVNKVVDSPCRLKFKLENGQEMTVLEYFRQEKRLNLQFPDLPCLHVGSPNRPNPIFLPVELCTVRSQVIVRKMTENQTSNMIKVAATSADRRKSKIMDALRKAGFNKSRTVQEFGFSVSDQFEKIPARILDAPPLEYNKQLERPMKGVWRAKPFLNGSVLSDWIILNLNNRFIREDQLRSFCTEMKRTGENLGMRIGPSRSPCSVDWHPRDMQRKLEEYLQQVKGIQLVVVVVPDRGDVYAKVKQTAELQVGVLTQCVKARTMGRMNPATVSNILLKVNSKLNGINHTLHSSAKPPCLLRPVMIVGADVTHPSPDQNDIPSVAAVCASHDPKAFCYNIQYRLQGPREEIIKDLENIMKEHLKFFFKQTKGYKPEKIIFYRDGVSEGQFAQVLNEELQAIRRACQSMSSDYQPQITFLVVQKRHHTRFFPLKPEDFDGRNNNVPPGTVVDTEITHPTEMDFYLVSHASIQGTSRPTKYRRLWDDSNMSEDDVEQLTYYLCHMFSRCTRAVSYPTPTYYAHLAAYRARVYIEGQRIQLDKLPEEQKRRRIQDVICRDSPMFFV